MTEVVRSTSRGDRLKKLFSRSESPEINDGLALILSGGGARGVYQTGVLTFVSERFPEFRPPIMTGFSAGALNATHLAASPADSFRDTVTELTELWSNITTDQVFEADTSLSTMWRLLIRRRSLDGRHPENGEPPIKGMVDTDPLRRYLSGQIETDESGTIVGIRQNIDDGRLKALAVLTANYSTGRTNAFTQGSDFTAWDRPMRKSVATDMTVEHVMASSALPLFFPAIKIGEDWHGDGGIRLTAPLAPALHLGADRLLVVSTRQGPTVDSGGAPKPAEYPSAGHILGTLMNAVFLDTLDQDVRLLNRINQLVEHLPKRKRLGLRRVEALLIRPSRSLSALADVRMEDASPGFRLFMRVIGAGNGQSPSWLSMLNFDPAYMQRLMELGYEDAKARQDDLDMFFAGKKVSIV